MTLRAWFLPARCGDFRLTATDGGCLLSVEDPTTEDRARLAPFLRALVERGLLPELPALLPGMRLSLPLAAPLRELGPLLAAESGAADAWTAVACVGGIVRVLDAQKAPSVPDDAEAAATVTPPRKGCPAPTPARRRASEVLATFCTPRQRAQFEAEGRLRACGSSSGRAYWVHHRDEAARRGLSRCVTEVATGAPVCAWDERVPPEEEVLALKLAIEHRERWLLAVDPRVPLMPW